MTKKKSIIPKLAKTVLIILGIFIGLILVIRIGLWIWVSTWPDYEKYGVFFKYPLSWIVEDLRPDSPGKHKYPYGQQYLISINNTPFIIETNDTSKNEHLRIVITRYPNDKLNGITAKNLLDNMRSRSEGRLSSVNKYYLNSWEVIEDVDIGKTEKLYTYLITTDKYVYSYSSIIFTENKPYWKIAWYDILSSQIVKSSKFIE